MTACNYFFFNSAASTYDLLLYSVQNNKLFLGVVLTEYKDKERDARCMEYAIYACIKITFLLTY
jgi:hypothetical protein